MTSVKGLVDRGLCHIPESYILPENKRPTATPIHTEEIPVIDLQGLHSSTRPDVLNAMAKACQEWGFFQVINHGVPQKVIDSMVEAHHRFFELPEEKKSMYKSEEIEKGVRYGTSFPAKNEEALHWRDYLGIAIPDVIDAQTVEMWPPVLRDAARDYSAHVKILAADLISALSESLGVPGSLDNVMKYRRLSLNYYRPCPNPEMTLGLGGHSDPGSLTLLLQDDVGGLQVFHNGRWIAVHPIHNAFVINVGDSLEVLSNGRFQSVEHRAVPSRNRSRISIPVFCNPDVGSRVAPLPELIDGNEGAKYRSFVYGDYLKSFLNRPLTGKADNMNLRSITTTNILSGFVASMP